MTKLWFKTKRGHIIDLNFVSYLYQTDHAENEVYVVLSDAVPTHMRIGIFDTKEEAQAYLDEIYNLLTGHIFHRCDECKKYPPLPKPTAKMYASSLPDYPISNISTTNSVDNGSKSVEE